MLHARCAVRVHRFCQISESAKNQSQLLFYQAFLLQGQEKYAKYSDANQGVILQSVRIEQERLQNEVNLAYQVFSQVATQLQLSRAKLQEEKPAFTIMEPASVPLYPTGTNSKTIVLGILSFSFKKSINLIVLLI